ncbi:hypothetical protein PX699_13485 [Sphingobium sp. H39-3-25]|uniref:hypothetical protein n=1 Tax=Sphingobium arseniciresistens TaxID=3030834 RepID=UPI0023B9942C|nr:hypothetical protein [Sphingobium arseniciresistens]
MYRALCFNQPVGPWRTCRNLAQEDLIEHELGEYTEWGTFYITVPGEMQIAYDSGLESIKAA